MLLQCIAGSLALMPDTKAVARLKAGCSAGQQWMMLLPAVQTTTALVAVGRQGSSLAWCERDRGRLAAGSCPAVVCGRQWLGRMLEKRAFGLCTPHEPT